jgi:hypothetical protein
MVALGDAGLAVHSAALGRDRLVAPRRAHAVLRMRVNEPEDEVMRRTVVIRALFVAVVLAAGIALALLGSRRTAAQVTGLDAGTLGLGATDAGALGTPALTLDGGLYGTGTSAPSGAPDTGSVPLPTVGGDAGIQTFTLDAGM